MTTVSHGGHVSQVEGEPGAEVLFLVGVSVKQGSMSAREWILPKISTEAPSGNATLCHNGSIDLNGLRRAHGEPLAREQVIALLYYLSGDTTQWLELCHRNGTYGRRLSATGYTRRRYLQASNYLTSTNDAHEYVFEINTDLVTSVSQLAERLHFHQYGSWMDIAETSGAPDWVGCGITQPQRPFFKSGYTAGNKLITHTIFHSGSIGWGSGQEVRLNGIFDGVYAVKLSYTGTAGAATYVPMSPCSVVNILFLGMQILVVSNSDISKLCNVYYRDLQLVSSGTSRVRHTHPCPAKWEGCGSDRVNCDRCADSGIC